MHSLLAGIRRENGLGAYSIAEPFAGGAGASLSLLLLEETPEITINDADVSIYAFWWVLLHQFPKFAQALKSIRVSMAEWRRQRTIYLDPSATRFRRAFATFFLNRCNRSGIVMNGGPIGGVTQRGRWNLGARFNKATLLKRCARVAEYRTRIHVSDLDGLELIGQLPHDTTMFFIDPPYYHKGAALYLNSLDHSYHERLADRLHLMAGSAWVLTYDDCPEIRRLYKGRASIRQFHFRYTAREQRAGAELLITPKWLTLPASQASLAIAW
jgi:DNA adenine methylase